MRIVGKKNLDGARDAARRAIQKEAEAARMSHPASQPGWRAVLDQKLREADRLQQSGALPDYSILAREAKALGVTHADAVQDLYTTHNEWTDRMMEIEVSYALAMIEINKASTEEEIRSVSIKSLGDF